MTDAKKSRLVYYEPNCPVCQNPISMPVQLTCGHVFDQLCIAKASLIHCPLCKVAIDKKAIEILGADDPVTKEIDAKVDWKKAYTELLIGTSQADSFMLARQMDVNRNQIHILGCFMKIVIELRDRKDDIDTTIFQMHEALHLKPNQMLSVMPIAPASPVSDTEHGNLILTVFTNAEAINLVLSSDRNDNLKRRLFVYMNKYEYGFNISEVNFSRTNQLFMINSLDGLLVVDDHMLIMIQEEHVE